MCIRDRLNCLLNQRTVLRIYLLIGFPKLKIHVLQTQTLTTISKYIQLHRWDMWRILFDCHRNASLAFHKPFLSLFFFYSSLLMGWSLPLSTTVYLPLPFEICRTSEPSPHLQLEASQAGRQEGREEGATGERMKQRKAHDAHLTGRGDIHKN